jgi:hypothetical protein
MSESKKANERPKAGMPLVEPVLFQARVARARTDHAKGVEAVERYRQQLIRTYGVKIKVKKEPYDVFSEPHFQAHELTHIALASETYETLGMVPRFGVEVSINGDAVPLRGNISESVFRTIWSELPVEDRWKQNILSTAWDRILDMVVEQKLRDNTTLKVISSAQFISLQTQMHAQIQQLKGYRQFCASTPKDQQPSEHLAVASLAIDCANALFVDRLLGGFTNFFSSLSSEFDSDSAKNLAQAVCDFVQGRIPCLEPAGECRLVDEVMEMTGLNGLYGWH